MPPAAWPPTAAQPASRPAPPRTAGPSLASAAAGAPRWTETRAIAAMARLFA